MNSSVVGILVTSLLGTVESLLDSRKRMQFPNRTQASSLGSKGTRFVLGGFSSLLPTSQSGQHPASLMLFGACLGEKQTSLLMVGARLGDKPTWHQ